MATGETKTTELTAGTEMAETDDFLVNIGTTTRQATVTVARTILNAADQTFSGAVTADSFTGDGSGLTGIASGTGGITNTGSTTIGADSDIDGVGVVALQTRTITRQTITNDGNIGFNTTDFGSGTGGVIGIANVTTAPSSTPTGGGVFYVESGLLKYKGTDGIVKVLSSEARITTSFWHTVNGFGSSSTKIQKFTTEVVASDDVVVTIVNSATLGFTITANMACKLDVQWSFRLDTSGEVGFSLNSSQLTTAIGSITTADKLALSHAPSANSSGHVSLPGFVLASSDVVRPHIESSADGNLPNLTSITVTATEII